MDDVSNDAQVTWKWLNEIGFSLRKRPGSVERAVLEVQDGVDDGHGREGRFEIHLVDSEHGFLDPMFFAFGPTGDKEGGVGLPRVEIRTRAEVLRLCEVSGCSDALTLTDDNSVFCCTMWPFCCCSYGLESHGKSPDAAKSEAIAKWELWQFDPTSEETFCDQKGSRDFIFDCMQAKVSKGCEVWAIGPGGKRVEHEGEVLPGFVEMKPQAGCQLGDRYTWSVPYEPKEPIATEADETWELWYCDQMTGVDQCSQSGAKSVILAAMANALNRGEDVWAVGPQGQKIKGTIAEPDGEETPAPVELERELTTT